jgi:hypothetical protein
LSRDPERSKILNRYSCFWGTGYLLQIAKHIEKKVDREIDDYCILAVQVGASALNTKKFGKFQKALIFVKTAFRNGN